MLRQIRSIKIPYKAFIKVNGLELLLEVILFSWIIWVWKNMWFIALCKTSLETIFCSSSAFNRREVGFGVAVEKWLCWLIKVLLFLLGCMRCSSWRRAAGFMLSVAGSACQRNEGHMIDDCFKKISASLFSFMLKAQRWYSIAAKSKRVSPEENVLLSVLHIGLTLRSAWEDEEKCHEQCCLQL